MAPPTTTGRGKEKFVQWKEPARVEPGQQSSGRGTSSSGTSRGARGRPPMTCAGGPTIRPPPNRTERMPGSVTHSGNERRVLPSISTPSSGSEHEVVTPESVPKRNSVLSGSHAPEGSRQRQCSEDHLVNAQDVEDMVATTAQQTQGRVDPEFSFYNDDNVDMTADSEDEEQEEEEEDQDGCPMEDSGFDYQNSCADIEDNMYQTETEKRRERRHELVARRREGDRRRAEGLPRNYLLVDKYSREPYGQGVGSWRKELMLLSRDLDPSIGNINRQPEDAVKAIGEWIQHTWEYERPIRWEFVKEVIARGVTLRRSELWKRIRLKQPQPEGMNDRIWRSLERQLRSPAMTKKFENCNKANACRQNFGRTGPSGEVGVRERLRKQFKRSPSPTEIKREMARPKGYGGRSKRHLQLDNIMHGSVDEGTNTENRRSTTDFSEANGDCPPNDTPELGGTEEGNDSVEGITGGKEGGRKDFTVSEVLTLSEDQVSQHPAFVRVMERLEALERMANNSAVAIHVEEDGHNSNPSGQERTEEVEVENHVLLHFDFAVMLTGHSLWQDMENADAVLATPATRKCGRPRKKPQQ